MIENGNYQIWMAHLSEINVQLEEIVEPGQVIGLSGEDRTQDEQAGNSIGSAVFEEHISIEVVLNKNL